MNDAEFESMMGSVNENGAVFDQQYFKREVTPVANDGKVSIPYQNSIRTTYGEDFLNEYQKHLEGTGVRGSLEQRGTLVNLSDIIRKKQEEAKKKASGNVNAADDGGHVSEVGTQGAVNNNNGAFTVEEAGGHVNTFSSKDEAKEYYLKILRRRLDLISKKYGVEFDPEFVELFSKDEFFVDGKVPSLEDYSDLAKIDKAWNKAEVMLDVPDQIDKVAEENYKAMQTVKRTALLYGDTNLYKSVVTDSDKIDDFLKKSKENALTDQKFYNEQKIKEKVETAILGIVSTKVHDNPELQEVIDVVKGAIQKRTDYMQEQTRITQFTRNKRVEAVQAASVEAASEFRSDTDRMVSLLGNRRDEQKNIVFSANPSEIKQTDPVLVTANPVNNYIEPVEPTEMELGGKQKVLKLTPRYQNPIDKAEAA